MDEEVLILAIVMGYGTVEALKAVIMLLKNRNGNGKRDKNDSRLSRIDENLRLLLEAHAHRDKDGVPLWYVPRRWGEQLEEMLKLQSKIIQLQERLIRISEHKE